ncbi:MAG: NAD-dependent epimerase/dehydratase family protein [Rectinemataceae bacterium]|jgi:nucleoside-diphosphate-sugar epimerase
MGGGPLKILVTGASGFIGDHLCAALAARGDSVRALYRRKTPPPELLALRDSGSPGRGEVELFRADLGDGERVCEAVKGVGAVIHAAALASDWGDLDLFLKANYDATVGLLEASRGAGASIFVYLSSAAVHGFGPHVDTKEGGPYYPLKYPYQITKLMTEKYVLAQNAPGFRTTAIRPCNVYGPGDRMSTYQMYDAIMDGIFGYIGSGRALTCPIYIDDLCAGVLAALDRSESGGEAIILTDGQKVAWKDYTRVMFAAVGSRKRPISLPKPIAFAAAWIMTAVARLFRSQSRPILTMYPVEQGSADYHFSNEKARELLGFEPRVFYEEGLVRTARAYLEDRRKTRPKLLSRWMKGDAP